MHLISKNMTNSIKAFAIIVVVIGHYARFKENPLPILSDTAYFGAAIFAFLSGYGTIVAYKDKGIGTSGGYLVSRLKRVYVPFVFVNLFAIPIYGINRNNILERVLFGLDDPVMWYPIFIIGYSIAFVVIYCLDIKDRMKYMVHVIVLLAVYAVMVGFHIPSQWYTSILSLMAGMTIAEYEDKQNKSWLNLKVLIISVAICALASITSRITSGNIKNLIISVSGMSCSVTIFYFFRWTEKFPPSKPLLMALSVIGTYSYWCYLLHMKVYEVVDRLIGTTGLLSFAAYLGGTIILTGVFALVSRRILNADK